MKPQFIMIGLIFSANSFAFDINTLNQEILSEAKADLKLSIKQHATQNRVQSLVVSQPVIKKKAKKAQTTIVAYKRFSNHSTRLNK